MSFWKGIRDIAAMASLVIYTGCAFAGGGCGTARTITAGGELSGASVAPGAVNGRGGQFDHVSVSESDWYSSTVPDGPSTVSWNISAAIPRIEVTGVHIHEGRRGENGRILLSAPQDFWRREEMFRIDGGGVYEGTVAVGVLFDAIAAGRAYVDIHTITFPLGELRAQLDRVQGGDWYEFGCT